MSIIVYILIILFGFLILNHIFEYCVQLTEGMTSETLHSLAGKVGGTGSSITNVKDKLNKTLERSKELLSKISSAGTTKSMNKAAGTHKSIQSLNLKPKPVDCENFQNQSTIEKLQSTSNLHTQNLGSLNGIITNINSNIKKIEDKLKGMKQKK